MIDNIKDKAYPFRNQFYYFLKGEGKLPYPNQEDYITFLFHLLKELFKSTKGQLKLKVFWVKELFLPLNFLFNKHPVLCCARGEHRVLSKIHTF